MTAQLTKDPAVGPRSDLRPHQPGDRRGGRHLPGAHGRGRRGRLAKARVAQVWWDEPRFRRPQEAPAPLDRVDRPARRRDLRAGLPRDRQARGDVQFELLAGARGHAVGRGHTPSACSKRAQGRARAGDAQLRRARWPTGRWASPASSRPGTLRSTPSSAAWPTRWPPATRRRQAERVSLGHRRLRRRVVLQGQPGRARGAGRLGHRLRRDRRGAVPLGRRQAGLHRLGADRPARDGGLRGEPDPGAARARRQGRDDRRRGRRPGCGRRGHRLGRACGTPARPASVSSASTSCSRCATSSWPR